MRQGSTQYQPDDRSRALTDFLEALERHTGNHHPIHIPLAHETESVAVVLYSTGLRGLQAQRCAIVVESVDGPEVHDLSDLTELTTSRTATAYEVVEWLEASFQLNQVGVLHRLRSQSDTRELTTAVDLAVYAALCHAVELRYRGRPKGLREDVSHELWGKHHQRWLKSYDPSLRGGAAGMVAASLPTYLYGQVRPKSLTRNQRINLGLEAEQPPGRLADLPPPGHEDNTALRIDLERTPEAQNELLQQRYVHDRTAADIARELGEPSNVTRARLHRLLTKLRKAVDP